MRNAASIQPYRVALLTTLLMKDLAASQFAITFVVAVHRGSKAKEANSRTRIVLSGHNSSANDMVGSQTAAFGHIAVSADCARASVGAEEFVSLSTKYSIYKAMHTKAHYT